MATTKRKVHQNFKNIPCGVIHIGRKMYRIKLKYKRYNYNKLP